MMDWEKSQIKKWWWWFLLIVIALVALAAHSAFAATPVIVSWNNPTTYDDGTAVDASKRATLVTKLYYTKDQQTWTYWASVSSGGTQYTGTWPLGKGIPGWVAATSTIPAEGNESAKSSPVGYTDQWAAPSPPVNLKIIKQ